MILKKLHVCFQTTPLRSTKTAHRAKFCAGGGFRYVLLHLNGLGIAYDKVLDEVIDLIFGFAEDLIPLEGVHCTKERLAVYGKVVAIGSANLDYRSLFLHFECNAVFYKADMVGALKADYLATQNESHEKREGDIKRGLLYRFGNNVLRLIAPLL